MCQQIFQFCSGSTKPLLIAGSSLTLLLAIVIGFTGCTTNALYRDIDPSVADAKSLGYHLQLAASAYCLLVALLGYYAAFYDQKHSIRALAIITTINFVFALATIAMVPSSAETSQLFEPRLVSLVERYDFTNKWPAPNVTASQLAAAAAAAGQGKVEPLGSGLAQSVNASSALATAETQNPRQKRAPNTKEVTKEEATAIWDSLQLRGCCGTRNQTETWKKLIPKSCCSRNETTNADGLISCRAPDQGHQRGCLELIGSTSMNLIIVLALIAVANFYLAIISGICAYRTFNYSEASQNAYN